MAMAASSSAELKSEIEMHIRYLKACQKIKLFAKRKITSQKTEEVLDRLSTLFCTFYSDSYINIVKEGWGQTILELWQALMTFRKTLFCYFGKSNRESQGYTNLRSLLSVWWNLTNGCQEFGDELVSSGVVPIMLEAIGDDDYFNLGILGVLHNCICMSHHNRDAFRNANAIHVLQRCLRSTSLSSIHFAALMILAYVVNENEREILATSEIGLRYLLNALKQAAYTEDHTGEDETFTWSAFETLNAINHLAINDTNKAEIEKQGAIPAIVHMLQDDISNDEERRRAAETLWNLSFVESIRESDILQDAIPTLDQLVKSTSSKELRVACASALWEINGRIPERVSTSSALVEDSPPTYEEATSDQVPSEAAPSQIMLSYQWDSQQLVLKIKDRLQKAGYRVWMDINNIRGDILIAMADAVKKSDVILLCMSERYQESRSCRSEATYAYKLKKQIIPLMLEPGYEPEGWLGLLQGMDLYYGFQSDEELERNMPTLLKVIGENTSTEHAEDTVDGPITPQKQETTYSGPAMSSPNPAAAAWTDEDVQDWLRKKKLNCPTLEAFDGSDLQELYVQLRKDENAFKHELKTGFHMDSPTSVRFTSALRKLFAE